MVNRIPLLEKSLEKNHFDGYIVADPTNILYLTGFVGATRLLISSKKDHILYVYGVNYEAARETVLKCSVELIGQSESVDKKAAQKCKETNLKNICYDRLDISNFSTLRKNLKNVKLTVMSNMIWDLRKVKDKTELHNIKKAAKLTDEGARIAAEIIKSGMREYEVAAEVEYAMRKLGSEGTAFDTIIASGTRSAYPHGGCTRKKILRGELIQFDLGARSQNYTADLTRTFVVGRPTSKQQMIYEIVKEAQEEAFHKIRDNVKAKNVDAAARNIINEYGFGECFVHGLGHGIGLTVHEPPILNQVSKDVLKAGNVVSNEPGIYLMGYGGIRIEDTVLVREDKAEKLTKADYEFSI